MSGPKQKITGIELLDNFELAGPAHLEALIKYDRQRGEAFIQRVTKKLLSMGKPPVEQDFNSSSSRRSSDNDASLNMSIGEEPSRHLGSQLSKLRQGYLVEALILKKIASEVRATTIDSLFDTLINARLLEIKSRSALITRLNRMKKVSRSIDWEKENRAQAIFITTAGVDRLQELMGSLLQATEIAYLKENASWAFDETKISNVVKLRVDKTNRK